MNARTTPMFFGQRNITVSDAEIHVVEGGPVDAEHTLFFLHGWPADWSSFARVMSLASDEHRRKHGQRPRHRTASFILAEDRTSGQHFEWLLLAGWNRLDPGGLTNGFDEFECIYWSGCDESQ